MDVTANFEIFYIVFHGLYCFFYKMQLKKVEKQNRLTKNDTNKSETVDNDFTVNYNNYLTLKTIVHVKNMI